MTATTTATVFKWPVLPAVDDGLVPYWRLVLRGCSQCCFQTNEVTGAIFLLAVLAYSWQMSSLLIGVASLLPSPSSFPAPRARRARPVRPQHLPDRAGARQLLRQDGGALDLGRGAVRWSPCHATSWCASCGSPCCRAVHPDVLGLLAVADTSDSPSCSSRRYRRARFFLAQVVRPRRDLVRRHRGRGGAVLRRCADSNWRHAVLALAAAFFAHAVALWWSPWGTDQLRPAGFNAVLAAVAIYAFCGSTSAWRCWGDLPSDPVALRRARPDLARRPASSRRRGW